MTLDKSGKLWRGENFNDLAEYIRQYPTGGYPVATVVERSQLARHEEAVAAAKRHLALPAHHLNVSLPEAC